MTDADSQIFARLTVHEYALEVLMAVSLASMFDDDADAWLVEFQRLMRSAWTRDPAGGSDPDLDRMLGDARQIGDRFLDKMRARLGEIRRRTDAMM